MPFNILTFVKLGNFYSEVKIKNISLIFLKKKDTRPPLVVKVNVSALYFLLLATMTIVGLSAFYIYISTSKFIERIAYAKEVLKYKGLIVRLDSLENTIDLESKLVNKVSILENDLSISRGIPILGDDIKKMGTGGRLSLQERAQLLIGSALENRILDIEETISNNKLQFDFLKERFGTIKEVSDKQKSYFLEKPSILPVSGRVTSEFGNRTHPVFERESSHEGIDIANLKWTPVKATADGICTYSDVKGSYGLLVEITHRNSGYVTRYAHLVNSNVKVGDIIKRGDIIANVGNTGISTGPHLHYEVRIGGRPINPRLNIVDGRFDHIID